MKTPLRIAAIALTLSLPIGLGACSSSGSKTTTNTSPQIANTVAIKDFAFIPKDLTVTKGSAVTWNNTQGVNHQIAIKDGAKANPIGQGGQTTLAFPKAGKFDYFCNIHNSMTGTVTVTG